MFEHKTTTKARATETQPAVPTRKLTDEREVLRARAEQVRVAEQAIAEMAANVTRLERIISDAAEADAALQESVAGDGAVSLTAFAAGESTPDSEIATLLANAENTARAAVAARAALPRAQANLAAAQGELGRLHDQRRLAERDFLLMIANEKARKYRKLFSELCVAHDELVGISNSLPPVSPTEPEVRMTTAPIQVPAFNIASGRANTSEWLAIEVHHANEFTVDAEASKWLSARERLANDVEADVSDLLEVAS
jgi:hypothetical protein